MRSKLCLCVSVLTPDSLYTRGVQDKGRTAGAAASTENDSVAAEPRLIRGVGLAGATTLNMIDMIGVGLFITLPLIVAAMGGPQAMIGWVVGAVLVVCDGLVWAELG